MTKSQHKRTAVASMFQNGISQNTKCAIRTVFTETVTYNLSPSFHGSPSTITLLPYSSASSIFYTSKKLAGNLASYSVYSRYTELP